MNMGWDAFVICEYKDENDQWHIGQDSRFEYNFTEDGALNIAPCVDTFWDEMRNYNLFRVLAGIHNSQETIDHEKEMFAKYDDDIKSKYSPETDKPVERPLGELLQYIPEDVSLMASTALRRECYDNYIVVVTLQQIEDFLANKNHQRIYKRLVELYSDAYAQYTKIALYCKKVGYNLSTDKFRLVFGFNV